MLRSKGMKHSCVPKHPSSLPIHQRQHHTTTTRHNKHAIKVNKHKLHNNTSKQSPLSSPNKLSKRLMSGTSSSSLNETTPSASSLATAADDDNNNNNTFDRESFNNIMLRRMYYIPSFEIYGGTAGLYDYGPPGSALMNNLQQLWRQHFVHHEQMLEISCTTLTPTPVLEASGHAARFTDYIIKSHDGQAYRADKVVEEHIEKLIKKEKNDNKRHELSIELNQVGSLDGTGLDNTIIKYNIKINGQLPTSAVPFNLMFSTHIGPTGKVPAYLRPETAQGIFVNFKRLYEANNRKLPFAAAQIGLAYRNEIAPRGGLLRVREFTMAEIEHFVDPDDKKHNDFHTISSIKAMFWSGDHQISGTTPQLMSIGDAVNNNIVNNETLGYYLGRSYLFLQKIGMDMSRVRFRQHQKTEMAHYAQDCWDAEIETSHGWVECIGHADRSAYDLKVHSDATGNALEAQNMLSEPLTLTKLDLKVNKRTLAAALKSKMPLYTQWEKSLSQEDLTTIKYQLDTTGQYIIPQHPDIILTKEYIDINEITVKESVISYTPHVIEPSFGLGRILYSLLEHSHKPRPSSNTSSLSPSTTTTPTTTTTDDRSRFYYSFPSIMAPSKVAICNVIETHDSNDIAYKLRNYATLYNIPFQLDLSKQSIGRKYVKMDELGTPYVIAIDSQSSQDTDNLVTLRNRDTMQQIQLDIEKAMPLVHDLINSRQTWDDALQLYPLFTPLKA